MRSRSILYGSCSRRAGIFPSSRTRPAPTTRRHFTSSSPLSVRSRRSTSRDLTADIILHLRLLTVASLLLTVACATPSTVPQQSDAAARSSNTTPSAARVPARVEPVPLGQAVNEARYDPGLHYWPTTSACTRCWSCVLVTCSSSRRRGHAGMSGPSNSSTRIGTLADLATEPATDERPRRAFSD